MTRPDDSGRMVGRRSREQTLEEATAFDMELYAAEKSLKHFAKQAWPVLEPTTELVWGWHHDAICEHLEWLTAGEFQRLIINVPPGQMKSLLASVMWPCWVWIHNPSFRWLCASYGADLSTRDNLRARTLIQSDWYQQRWGHVYQFAEDQKQKTRYNTDRAGWRISTSVGGGGMGERPDGLIIDDPASAEQAHSATHRETCRRWYSETMSTRGSDPGRFIQLLIAQRLHTHDLPGHWLEQGDCVHLRLPMRFEAQRPCETVKGWRDPRTEPGDLLDPVRFPEREVRKLEARLGSASAIAGQLQQAPVPDGGDLFKQPTFRYYRQDGLTVELDDGAGDVRHYDLTHLPWFQTSDTASTKGAQADRTATGTFAYTPDGDLLLIDVVALRVEAASMFQHLDRQRDRWGAGRLALVGVENAASGIAVLQEGRNCGKPFVELKPKGSKQERAIAAAILYSAGKVWHPAGRPPWLIDYEDELVKFPNAPHDDQVDMIAYAAWVVATWGKHLLRVRREGPRVWADFAGWEQLQDQADRERRAEEQRLANAPEPDGTALSADDAPAREISVLDVLGIR